MYRNEGGAQRDEIKASATRLVSKLADINLDQVFPSLAFVQLAAFLHSCSFACMVKRTGYVEGLLYAVRWCDLLDCLWWTTVELSGERSGTDEE